MRLSVVLAARDAVSPQAAQALERLCRTSWFPVYAHVRRQGRCAPDAQDLVQGFFARLLQGNFLENVGPQKGKFRSFLLAALNHFLSDEWDKARAEKRGGGQTLISLDDHNAEELYHAEPDSNLTAERMFEQRWALTLLAQASERVNRIDRDLDTICLKCLRKDPNARYASAETLANDLARWQDGEPIQARPIGPTARLWRWCWRKPVVAGLGAVAVLLLLAVAVTFTGSAIRIEQERRTLRQNLYASDMNVVQHALEDGNYGLARRTLEAHRPAPGQEDLRGFEWRYFSKLCQSESLETWRGHSNFVTCVAVSRDGKTLASGDSDGSIRLWDLASRRVITTFLINTGQVNSVAFFPDGKRLITASMDETLKLWSAEPKETTERTADHLVLSPSYYDTIVRQGSPQGISFDVFVTMTVGSICSSPTAPDKTTFSITTPVTGRSPKSPTALR